jgi:hypothetical protein
MDSMADIMNRIAIPRLLAMNPSMDPELAPKLVPGEIGIRDLEEISRFIMNLSQAGLTFFDADTEAWVRKVAKMPEKSSNSLATTELPLHDDQEIILPDVDPKPKPKPAAKPKDATEPEGDAPENLEQAV